jgi:hypothetical protein
MDGGLHFYTYHDGNYYDGYQLLGQDDPRIRDAISEVASRGIQVPEDQIRINIENGNQASGPEAPNAAVENATGAPTAQVRTGFGSAMITDAMRNLAAETGADASLFAARNVVDPTSANQRAIADIDAQQAARAAADAQRNYQVANRDERVEADKDAASRSAAMFNQAMANTSGAAGAGGAALAASQKAVVDPTDTLQMRLNRADTEFSNANDLQSQSESARANAQSDLAAATNKDVNAQREATYNVEETNRALGVGNSNDQNTQEKVPAAPTSETPAAPKNSTVPSGSANSNMTWAQRSQYLSDLPISAADLSQLGKLWDAKDVQGYTAMVNSLNAKYGLKAPKRISPSIVPSDRRLKRLLSVVNRRFL